MYKIFHAWYSKIFQLSKTSVYKILCQKFSSFPLTHDNWCQIFEHIKWFFWNDASWPFFTFEHVASKILVAYTRHTWPLLQDASSLKAFGTFNAVGIEWISSIGWIKDEFQPDNYLDSLCTSANTFGEKVLRFFRV